MRLRSMTSWRFALAAVLACAALLTTKARAQQPARDLTVERIYGAPSLSGQLLPDTRWSPDGKWLSYLTGNGGQTEIWVADASTGERRVLVDATHLRDVLLPPAS